MKSDGQNTGVKPILRSLGADEPGRLWEMIRLMASYLGWLFLPFVGIIYFLFPREGMVGGFWIYAWFAAYLAYHVVMEVLSRVSAKLYESSLLRIVRIQLVVFLASALLLLTGGSESYFWFFYLWPLFASALYFPGSVTWGIYVEVAVLYFLVSLLVTGDLAQINYALLITNLAVLFVLTAVLRYLAQSVKRYQTAENKLRYSEILQQIQQDVDTAIDLQEVLDRIIGRAVELVGAKDGSLLLLDEKGELHFRARVRGLLPADKEERSFKLGQGVAGWVAETGKYYICRDTRNDPKFAPIISGSPIRSLVSVPIISHTTVLGVISVDSAESNRFSHADAELLTTLANQVAVAIERAALLDSLMRIGEKTLGGAEDLYEQIVDGIHRLTRCPVALWQVDEKTRNQATIRAYRELREEYVRDRVLDLEHSATGEAIHGAEPIEISDIENDPRVEYKTKAEAAQQGWQSMLIVPLLAGPGRAIGSLSAYSLTKKKFAPWEIDVLRTFASQAGVAIQNAERLQTIQRLNQVGQSLITLQESPQVLQETLQRITDTAVQVLGADLVDLYQYHADTDSFDLPPIRVGDLRFPEFIPKEISPDDVVFRIVHDGDNIFASDAQKHQKLTGRWETPREERPKERFVVREEVISSAAVPLKAGTEVLGVMFVSYRQERNFDLETELLEKIEIFANQAAVSIQNARLLQKERSLRQQAETLREVSGAISSALELKESGGKILDELSKVVQYRRASMQLIKGNKRELIAYRGFGEEAVDEWLLRPISEDRLIRRVVAGKRPVILSHTETDPDWEVLPATATVKSWVGLPLGYGDETLGLLTLDHDEPDFYTQAIEGLLVSFAHQSAAAIHNAQLFQALNEKATQFERLQQVTTAISADPSQLDKVAHLIVDSLSQILQGASCAIRLYDSRTDTFKPQRGTGVFNDLMSRPPRYNGTSRYVVKTKVPRYLEGDGLRVPPDGGSPVREDILERGVKAAAYLPLVSKGDVIGILYANLTDAHQFSQEEKQILELFAGQATIAIKNARLFEDAQHRIRDLEIVNEVTQIISTKLSTRELFQTIVSQIAERLKCSHATLFLEQLEDGERLLVPQMTSGLYSEQIMQRRFRPDEGLAGWVFRQGKSLVFPDVREDPRFAGATFERDLPRSMLLAPIKVGDQTIGVISADQDQLGWFSESDRLLVEALAQQVGIAIQRSIGLELLNDIGNQIISIQEEDRILQYIVSGAIKLTNTTSGVIYLIGDDGLSVVNKYQWPHDLDLPTPRLTNREGLTYAIVTKAKTIIIPDIDEAGREHFKLWKLDARSVIGVPLKLEQKVIGVLYLHDKDPHHFTETELSLISSLANQAAIAIGNARLLEQVRKEKEERIEAIREIGFGITAGAKLEEILDQLLKTTINLMGKATLGEIWLLEEESGRLRVQAAQGDVASGIKELAIGEGIVGWVAQTKQPYLSLNVKRDTQFVRRLAGTRSELAVAMLKGDELVGVLNIEHPEANALDDEDVQLLEAIASQVVIAIENARLFKNLEALAEIGRTVSTLGANEILEQIHTQAGRVMDARNFYIAFYDETTDTVSFPLAYSDGQKVETGGGPWVPRHRARHLREGEERKPGEPRYGLTEYVIDDPERKAQISKGDIREWARERRIELSPDIPTKSWIGAPLKVGGREEGKEKVIGIISIQSYKKVDSYDEDDRQVLEAMANQAAVAIENARLYKDLRVAYDELRRAHEREILAMLGEVAAGLIHKMSNTIGPIPLLTKRIRETLGPIDVATEKKLNSISQGAADALAYTTGMDQILHLGKVSKEPANVQVLLDDALNQVIPDPAGQNITLDISYSPMVLMVYVNAPLLITAFQNIIHNAVEAMPSGGTLKAYLQKVDGSGVQIQITDTGCGIPENRKPKIFEVGVSSKKEGKGIGLWFSKKVIDLHQGDISFTSQEHVGTTFTIFLPVGPPTPPQGIVGQEVSHV